MGKKFDYNRIPPYLRLGIEKAIKDYLDAGYTMKDLCGYICSNPEYKKLLKTKRPEKKLAKAFQNKDAYRKHQKDK